MNYSSEELRVLIVLGIIGVLFSAYQFWPGITLAYGWMTLGQLIKLLIIFWGGYLILLAMGISDDWIRPSVAKICYDTSITLFVSGMGLVTSMAILVFLTRYVGSGLALIFSMADLIAFVTILPKKRPNVWKQVSGVPTDDQIYRELLRIDCPKCGAKVGERCKGKYRCDERFRQAQAIAYANLQKNKEVLP
jgi:hypothetical protein